MRRYILLILLQISVVGQIVAVPVTLPVLPLPKSWKVMSYDVVGHEYGSIQFSFVEANICDYKRICDEITDLRNNAQKNILKINGTICNSKKAVAQACSKSGLDVSDRKSVV